MTLSVVSAGTIELTDPGANTSVLATLKRDESGRQIVTVDTKSGFSLEIPLVDFDRLGKEASNIANFMTALTAPVPANVSGMGPGHEDYYRRLVAHGLSPASAESSLQSPQIQKFITIEKNWASAVTHYGSSAAVPGPVRAAIANGETIDFSSGTPSIVSDCAVAGQACAYTIIRDGGIEAARVLVANAGADIRSLTPQALALWDKFRDGTATEEDRKQFAIIEASLRTAYQQYALCADNVGEPPLWAVTSSFPSNPRLAALQRDANDSVALRNTRHGDAIDEGLIGLEDLIPARGIAKAGGGVVGMIMLRSGGRIVARELTEDGVSLLVKADQAFIDDAGKLLIRETGQVIELTEGQIIRVLGDAITTDADGKIRLAVNSLEELPAWQQRLFQGIAFNQERRSAFPFNEVAIESATSKNGKVFLDSYNPAAGEIVSRKWTQLSDVTEETAVRYLNELANKYPADATIAATKETANLIAEYGDKLKGSMILEVPPQAKDIPAAVLAAADKLKITIRDSSGRVYP